MARKMRTVCSLEDRVANSMKKGNSAKKSQTFMMRVKKFPSDPPKAVAVKKRMRYSKEKTEVKKISRINHVIGGIFLSCGMVSKAKTT